MPGGDRTGPMGQGPRTGRGAGYCGDTGEAGYTTAPGGRGFFRGRRGRGFGAGRGRGGRASDVEAEPLQTDSLLQRLMNRIASLEQRLAGLEGKD